MRQNEFKHFLESTSGYDLFMMKAQEYQEEKNNSRKKKERWNEGKVCRATEAMWTQLVENMHEKLEGSISCTRFNRDEKWNDFIEKNDFVSSFNESIAELEFD